MKNKKRIFLTISLFQAVDPTVSPSTLLQGQELLTEEEALKASSLHVASGEKWGRRWTYLLDAEAGRL